MFYLSHPYCLHPQVPRQQSLPLWQELSIPVPASFSSFITPSHPCWAWLPKATLWCHLSTQSPLAPARCSRCGVTAPCLVFQALCTLVATSPWHLISLCCSIQLPPCVWSRYFLIKSELSSRADSRGTPHLIDSVNALPGAVSLYDQRASGLCACCFLVLEGCLLPATCENQTLLQMSLLPGSPWGSPLLERIPHVNGSLKK